MSDYFFEIFFSEMMVCSLQFMEKVLSCVSVTYAQGDWEHLALSHRFLGPPF